MNANWSKTQYFTVAKNVLEIGWVISFNILAILYVWEKLGITQWLDDMNKKRQGAIGETQQNEGQKSNGSFWAFLLLLCLFWAYAFNYLYELLGPWDPLGIYQPNRKYMGVYY